MIEDESDDERFVLDNWNLLSEETRSMLKLVGVNPKNGKKAN
ncbi:MAG: hypothetical protein U9O94_00645 [Nanoarchaeota archaeon]|nr:hypothetical protein [Nanoarchaeota archaeon]